MDRRRTVDPISWLVDEPGDVLAETLVSKVGTHNGRLEQQSREGEGEEGDHSSNEAVWHDQMLHIPIRRVSVLAGIATAAYSPEV